MQYKNKNKYLRHRNMLWLWLAAFGVFLLIVAGVYFLGWSLFHGSAGRSLTLPFTRAGQDELSYFKTAADYPVAVMIDNSPEARPYHAGLADALVVYETLAEGGSTRLEAVFAGAPAAPRIGPVRSSRPYFVQLAAGWGAFYWHAGGSPEGLALLKNLAAKKELTALNEISGYGPIYLWRDASLAAPHNLFTSGEKIAKALSDFGLNDLPADKLTWRWGNSDSDKDAKTQAERSAGAAANIEVVFSPGLVFNPSYVYDPAGQVYKRSLAKKAQPLAPANVIIQKVPGERLLPSGYDRIDFDIVGEGEALYFRDGEVFAGRWKKESTAGQTEWLLAGRPYILKPGQTWVEIVPGQRAVIYN